jgi:sortase (surface protein transpeptidase)
MTGYIILIVFAVFVIGCFFSFIGGWRFGKKQAEAEYAEEQRIKAQNEKDYKQAAQEIKQEAFNEAEKKKAGLSGGDSGHERFDAINNSLRNNPPH